MIKLAILTVLTLFVSVSNAQLPQRNYIVRQDAVRDFQATQARACKLAAGVCNLPTLEYHNDLFADSFKDIAEPIMQAIDGALIELHNEYNRSSTKSARLAEINRLQYELRSLKTGIAVYAYQFSLSFLNVFKD